MTSFKENEAWKEASEAERSAEKAKKGRRKAPFYKVLQGMPIAIDAFRYGAIPGVNAYFLTYIVLTTAFQYSNKGLDMHIPTITPIYPRLGNTAQSTAPKALQILSSICSM